MITFRTTDLTKKKLIDQEDFLNKSFRVVTRSGLHYLESIVIESFSLIKEFKGKALFLENRTAVAPMIFKSLYPEADVTVQNYDIHHTNIVKRTLEQNEMENKINLLTDTNLPDSKFDIIFLQAPKDMANELIQDTIQQIEQKLNKDTKTYLAFENRIKAVKSILKSIFDGSTTALQNKHAFIEIAKKRSKAQKTKDFICEFTLPSKSLGEVKLISMPGVFSHRRADQGALAMTETIVIEDNAKLLDLGCGCGSIGITLALMSKNIEVTFVDSNARAIQCTKINCEKNNLTNCGFILSDNGVLKENYFDVVVGNPPYFSDYKIAEMFLETALNNLKPNGKVYMVAKSIEWFEVNMERIFGNVEIVQRRGYGIASSIKNN